MRATSDIPLEVKLGQMLMVGFRGATPEECAPFLEPIRRHHVGGVWLTDAESPMGRVPGNIRSPQQLKELTAALQNAVITSSPSPVPPVPSPADQLKELTLHRTQPRSFQPLLIAIDGEGGQVIRLKQEYGFPRFPSPQTLGERDDVEFTRTEAKRLATTLCEAGVNFNLAPVVDVNRNPANQVINRRGRSFSSDPRVVTRHATAFIEAHHERGILCALKHFPGHGSSSTDSHLDMVDVTQTWSLDELLPYRELVARGLPDAVLSAHVFIRHIDNDAPATLSRPIMTGLLREQIGFDGVVLSDDMNMGAIAKHFGTDEALERAINAGIDIIVHGNVDHYDEQIIEHTLDSLQRLVHAGRISEERINESVARIMALKTKLSTAAKIT